MLTFTILDIRIEKKILQLKEARDNQGIYNINIFESLAKLHEQMETETDKRRIREEIQILRVKIQKDN